MGPTPISALLTYQICKGVWQRAIVLTFLTGLIELIMGLLQLGFLMDFISGPVSAGFTSAASVIIFVSQFKVIFVVDTSGNNLIEMIQSMHNDIHNISWSDTGMGLVCVVLLVIMKFMRYVPFGPKEGKNGFQKFMTALFGLISSAKNAFIMLAAGKIVKVLR